MKEDDSVTQLARYYSGQPIIQALAQLVPYGSSLDVLLKARAQEIGEERARIFYDELAQEHAELTSEIIQSEEFIHKFVITARAAANTRRQEKIRLFSRLLSSSMDECQATSTDEYEEYVRLLDDLSYREFVILDILEKHETLHPAKEGENDLQRSFHFWEAFTEEVQQKLSISRSELDAILTRLNRTGCYSTFTGTYTDYEGNQGKLTDLYLKLKKLL